MLMRHINQMEEKNNDTLRNEIDYDDDDDATATNSAPIAAFALTRDDQTTKCTSNTPWVGR
jgi:hypothetical protein